MMGFWDNKIGNNKIEKKKVIKKKEIKKVVNGKNNGNVKTNGKKINDKKNGKVVKKIVLKKEKKVVELTTIKEVGDEILKLKRLNNRLIIIGSLSLFSILVYLFLGIMVLYRIGFFK